MKLMNALTLTQTSLEEITLGLIRKNIDEYKKDKMATTDKYFREAFRIKTKAFQYCQENIDQISIMIESGIETIPTPS